MEGKVYSILHLFVQTGRTYTFRDVQIVSNNETAITIKYQAMSDGKEKIGVFFWTNLIGYSVAE